MIWSWWPGIHNVHWLSAKVSSCWMLPRARCLIMFPCCVKPTSILQRSSGSRRSCVVAACHPGCYPSTRFLKVSKPSENRRYQAKGRKYHGSFTIGAIKFGCAPAQSVDQVIHHVIVLGDGTLHL